MIYLFLLSVLIFPTYSYGQASEGINFFEGTWEEALAEAKSNTKVIFLHAYTSWCGYCKTMQRNTFRRSEVGEFFNSRFINVKMDMEKGEGPELAYTYQVHSYPTSLFIDYLGRLILRDQGYKAPDEFLHIAEEALSPSHNRATLALSYNSGKASPQEMLYYAYLLKVAEEDYRTVARDYFSTQKNKELLNERNWEAIQKLTHHIDSREFNYLLAKKKKFEKRFGKENVNPKIASLLKNNVITAVITGDDGQYQRALKISQQYMNDGGELASRLRMTLAATRKEWQNYAFKAVTHFEKYSSTDAKELHLAASHFLHHIQREDLLTKAILWSKQAVALDNSYTHFVTYAALLYKTGQYEKAKAIANQSVHIARKEGVSPGPSMKILREINTISQ